jgi:hypothetical protein
VNTAFTAKALQKLHISGAVITIGNGTVEQFTWVAGKPRFELF